jgi:hypothetical protein
LGGAHVDHDFPKLTAMAGREPRIKDSPPLIYHPRSESEESLLAAAHYVFAGYRESLAEDRRRLVDRNEVKDLAIKVVGRRRGARALPHRLGHRSRTTQRKPRWQVEVSIGCAMRAAGR